jgi:hypothetical protein
LRRASCDLTLQLLEQDGDALLFTICDCRGLEQGYVEGSEPMAQGAWGAVWRGRMHNKPNGVAVKMLHKGDFGAIDDPEGQRLLQKEVEVMAALKVCGGRAG